MILSGAGYTRTVAPSRSAWACSAQPWAGPLCQAALDGAMYPKPQRGRIEPFCKFAQLEQEQAQLFTCSALDGSACAVYSVRRVSQSQPTTSSCKPRIFFPNPIFTAEEINLNYISVLWQRGQETAAFYSPRISQTSVTTPPPPTTPPLSPLRHSTGDSISLDPRLR